MPTEGIVPYRICEIVITKNTSVNTDPQRWIVDPIGIAKSTIYLSRTDDLWAHFKATANVAALDIVPRAVK